MMKQNNVDILAGITRLVEAFPATFHLYEARRKPLKIGIHNDILATLGDAIDARELSAVLGYYCTNQGYLRQCAAGAARIDLNGSPAGEVTAAEAARAARLLERHAAKAAQKAAATEPEPASPSPSIAPAAPEPTKRLGLRDLKAAWALRKAS